MVTGFIDNLALQTIEISGLSPLMFFLTGLSISALILLLDLSNDIGVSLDVPGPGQWGIAGIILIGSALTSFIARNGATSLIAKIQADIISFGLIGVVIIGFFFARRQ
jgi:hypothetical protein